MHWMPEIGPNRAQVTNTGRGDIPEDLVEGPIGELIKDTDLRAIIGGIGKFALRNQQASAANDHASAD